MHRRLNPLDSTYHRHHHVIVLFALFRQVSQLSSVFKAPHRRHKLSNAGEWAVTPINDA
jgi:hypothetical protein